MELPLPLRRAVDRVLSGVATADLAATAAALSRRYRADRDDGAPPVASDKDVLAYLAARLPATYAAVRASFAAVAEARADFAPATMLDVGSGPGTALWAAADCWPDIATAVLVEASRNFQARGIELAAAAKEARLPQTAWRIADIAADPPDSPPADLVTSAYVLNELAPEVRPSVVRRLWQWTAGILVIVEPGTPAGWRRILAARRQLIDGGAHLVAPCPHARDCPLEPPDWCHFAQRVARSRLHRQTKRAAVPWEDEKFSYVAVSRAPAAPAAPAAPVSARVIARPRKGGGHVTLKLCRPDGSAGEHVVSRRDGALFKRASRSVWGSAI